MDINTLLTEAPKLMRAVQHLQVGMRQLTSNISKLGDPEMLIKKIEELEGKQLSFRQYTMLHAEKTIPFRYVVPITLVAASTARIQGPVTISQEGYFFLDRYYFSWEITQAAAANIGRFRPISSGNAFIAGSEAVALAGGGAAVVDELNFFYEFTEGRAERNRQNAAVPGDIVFRGDADGILGPEGDAFGPNSTLNVFITPSVAPAHTGILYATLEGVQCLDYLKG